MGGKYEKVFLARVSSKVSFLLLSKPASQLKIPACGHDGGSWSSGLGAGCVMLCEGCGLVRDLVPWQREEALLGARRWQGEVWSARGIPLLLLQMGLTSCVCHESSGWF